MVLQCCQLVVWFWTFSQVVPAITAQGLDSGVGEFSVIDYILLGYAIFVAVVLFFHIFPCFPCHEACKNSTYPAVHVETYAEIMRLHGKMVDFFLLSLISKVIVVITFVVLTESTDCH